MPKLTKAEILRRRHYLTAEGYQEIIDTVKDIHGKEFKPRTVDAYIRLEPIHRTGRLRDDEYGIRPLFIAVTDKEKQRRVEQSKQRMNQIKAA